MGMGTLRISIAWRNSSCRTGRSSDYKSKDFSESCSFCDGN